MTLRELIEQEKAQLAQFGDNYEAIAAALNAPTTVDNPNTTPYEVANPPTLLEIYELVGDDTAAALYDHATLSADIRNAIDSGNQAYIQMMMRIAIKRGVLTLDQAQAVGDLLQRTQTVTPPATIAGPSLAAAAGLGTVSSAQIQQAMN